MTAIITGATKGIGRAIACKFAQEGIDIVAISSSISNLTALKSTIEQSSDACCHIHQCDLSNPQEREKLIIQLGQYENQLTILVNNFGVYQVGELADISTKELQANFDQNVITTFELSKFAGRIFKEKRNGYIFSILSVLAKQTRASAAAYTISKHAMHGLCKLLADDLREYNVKVCNLFPGSVNTSSWDGLEVDRSAMIQPEDIAKLVSESLKLSSKMFIENIDLSPTNKTV
jgi:hypothetical protein